MEKIRDKEGELMIEIKNIHIAFDEVLINDGSLKIMPGKLTAVCGMSGSGKTSLLYIAGLLRNDKKRTYLFNGYEMSHKESEEALYRKKYIGYVFQENSLLEHLNIYENISFYANMADITMTEKDAEALLESVHLDKDLHESITHLSGGERQRLAIACALCKKPQLIVLDEPTSALDHDNIETILEILREQASQGLMILVASHDQTVISACDIVYEIKNQQLLCNQDLKNNDKTVFLPQKKGLGLKFYLNYYKLYLKQHFSIQLSMFMMCGLSIAVFLAYQGIAEAMERKITMNQNLIGNTELMIQGENVNEELLEEIRQHPYCKDAHAFSQMQILEVNGKQMDGVAWSFSKEKGLNKASVKLPTLQQQGVYMTQEMAVALGVNQEYQGNISLKLKTTDETIIELKEIAVMGIINVEMDNPYTDATPSLYVSHELLNQTHHFNRILAYAIHYDNTSHLQNIILEMDDSLEVIVYSPYMRTDGQVVALESINTYCPFIMKVTFILMVTMMFLVYSKYVTSRKLEICLLKANGMNRLEVFILIILELCIQALLIASFAVFFVTLICKGMEMLLATMIPVAYLHTYLSSIIFSFVVMVVPSVIGLAFYQFYDPAVILRND